MNTKQQSQKEIIGLLTENLTSMYDKGALHGSQSIVIAITEKLKQHVGLENCAEDIKPGLLETIKFLDSVLSGKPYQLKVTENNNKDVADTKPSIKPIKKPNSEKTLNA